MGAGTLQVKLWSQADHRSPNASHGLEVGRDRLPLAPALSLVEGHASILLPNRGAVRSLPRAPGGPRRVPSGLALPGELKKAAWPASGRSREARSRSSSRARSSSLIRAEGNTLAAVVHVAGGVRGARPEVASACRPTGRPSVLAEPLGGVIQ